MSRKLVKNIVAKITNSLNLKFTGYVTIIIININTVNIKKYKI